jgi:hypothetical protein
MRYCRIGGELVDPGVPLEQRKQLAELMGAWLQDLQDFINRVEGLTTSADAEESFVVHGDTLPLTLPSAKLHRNLTEADGDLHWPRSHRTRHVTAGSDAFTSGDIIDAAIRYIRESSDPATLAVGAILDGEFLKRVGATVVSGSVTGGSLAGMGDGEEPTQVDAVTYRWNNAPNPALSLIVEVNGLIQCQRAAAGPEMGYYSQSGTDSTFEELPSDIRHIRGWYRY